MAQGLSERHIVQGSNPVGAADLSSHFFLPQMFIRHRSESARVTYMIPHHRLLVVRKGASNSKYNSVDNAGAGSSTAER